ncbi:MAG: RidA family protein [Hamadaea sp.]|uniref:RidA family protein n=1 Tax=Hamadaea sp. TaxID=2024425 RepID=UPI001801E5F5|nr:RidA family protein [Hamadaea sp.]NUR69909.1 RidA family protein [Hamadaea sp.]NUT22513.1 RidA family protein [Hamadaea sp.]
MPKKIVQAEDVAPSPAPLSHAVVAGEFAYLSGQVPTRPDGTWVKGDFAEQARAAFDNLANVARACGGDLGQAVRVGVYLRDWADFAEMNEIYREYFPADAFPARTTVPVALNGFDIEVDAVLYLG